MPGDEFPPDQVPDLPALPDLPGDDPLSPAVAFSGSEDQPATDSQLEADSQVVTVSEIEEALPETVTVVEEARPLPSDGWTAVKRTETPRP